MTSVYVMLGIAALLMIYEFYFREHDDDLDSNGRPKKKR